MLLSFIVDLTEIDAQHVNNLFYVSIVEGFIFGQFHQLINNLSLLTGCEILMLTS